MILLAIARTKRLTCALDPHAGAIALADELPIRNREAARARRFFP